MIGLLLVLYVLGLVTGFFLTWLFGMLGVVRFREQDDTPQRSTAPMFAGGRVYTQRLPFGVRGDDYVRSGSLGSQVDAAASEAAKLARYDNRPGRELTAFFASDGSPLPVRHQWGDIPTSELVPMFLDQFLIRYFHWQLIQVDWSSFQLAVGAQPWLTFTAHYRWAAELPVLFEQLTGRGLAEIQLDQVILLYVDRLRKIQRGNGDQKPAGSAVLSG